MPLIDMNQPSGVVAVEPSPATTSPISPEITKILSLIRPFASISESVAFASSADKIFRRKAFKI